MHIYTGFWPVWQLGHRYSQYSTDRWWGARTLRKKEGRKYWTLKLKAKNFFFEDEKYKIEKSVSEEENNYIL